MAMWTIIFRYFNYTKENGVKFMNEYIYVVAGDEMCRLMKKENPNDNIIPFREDLSKGHYSGFVLDEQFMKERAGFWGVSILDYESKLSPIINLDLSKKLILCFGEDDCCRANLDFLIHYLQAQGYKLPIQVRIVDEMDLQLKKEYQITLDPDFLI